MNTVPQPPVDGFIDSTPLLKSPDALNERVERDGFLYFKNFLPEAPLLELRRQMLEVLQNHDWLKEDAPLMDGVSDLDAIVRSGVSEETLRGLGTSGAVYRDVQKLELFHSLPHHPKLIALYETVFGEPVLPHPRHIARVMVPTPSSAPTPPHQDYIYIQGTHQFWTLWFPLGDCPVELGSLSMLRGSHKEPVLDVTEAQGAGGREAILCDKDEYEWVQGDYGCGDIITFPSHLVHQGLPNQYSDRIRLSCDLRYQPADAEVEEQSLRPHMGVGSWEDIYADWKSDEFKYYWRENALNMAPWDGELLAGKERLC